MSTNLTELLIHLEGMYDRIINQGILRSEYGNYLGLGIDKKAKIVYTTITNNANVDTLRNYIR